MRRFGRTLFRASLGAVAGFAIIMVMDGKTRAKVETELLRRLDSLRERVHEYQKVFEGAVQEGRVASQAREADLRKKMAQSQRHGEEPPDYIV